MRGHEENQEEKTKPSKATTNYNWGHINYNCSWKSTGKISGDVGGRARPPLVSRLGRGLQFSGRLLV
jgi:hypothetical protein